MAFLDVVFRVLDKAGVSFIEPRREDGHGSNSASPSHVLLPASQVQTNALTDAQLRATAVAVDTGLIQPTTPADTQPVSAAALPLPAGAATAAKQLPDNHQVTVSNLPAEYPLPAAQVAALTPQADALTDAQLRATPVTVTTERPTQGAITGVAASLTQVTLLAANSMRKGATIYNESTLAPMKIALAASITATSYTMVINADGYYEVPFGYTGPITALWTSTLGVARVTEIT